MNSARPWWLAMVAPMAVVLAAMAGCQPGPSDPPYAPKPAMRPEPVYCFDTVGHIRGSKPFIFGGTCCCTPTKALMDKYHADGLLTNMALADLVKAYEERGIKTALDHQGCNNLCECGPHLVKGGKCMVPPTPGTGNFEEVRFGIKYLPAGQGEPAKQEQKVAGASQK